MQAYKIMAKNTRTGLRVQQQYLTGYLVTDLETANLQAQDFAQQQTARSGDSWQAVVETYTVGHKPGSQ
jgi:hypothetical protein